MIQPEVFILSSILVEDGNAREKAGLSLSKASAGTFRRETTRQQNAEVFSRYKCMARTIVGMRQKRLLCDPGSELRRWSRRTQTINGWEKRNSHEGSDGMPLS